MTDKRIAKVLQWLFILAGFYLLSFQGFIINTPNVQAVNDQSKEVTRKAETGSILKSVNK